MASDDTVRLPRIKRAPARIASEADESAELLADLFLSTEVVQRLMAVRADAAARDRIHTELQRVVAAAQRLDGHLRTAKFEDQEDRREDVFLDWFFTSGGQS